MIARLATRILTSVDRRCLWKLAWNFGWGGMRSVQRFKQRLKRGVVFPPFLHISLVNSCNLRCQGCWVDVAAPHQQIDLQQLHRLIRDARAHGNRFFGLLGGEPFMHTQLFDVLEAHPDCYFQIFTNGQFITEQVAERLRRAANATPLISIEGTEIVSDERRGRAGVLSKTMRGLENCVNAGLFTGVATSVCASNIDDLLTERWIDELIRRGVHYVWYHTYRAVGADSKPELALTPEQSRRHRQFIVDIRCDKPIGVVDAYFDDQGRALCPSATGISHHISPWGDIEPCPIIQFARESIDDERGIYETMTKSRYLGAYRDLARRTTRGCIVLERPDLLQQFVVEQRAQDTTTRRTALAELAAMQPRTSQYQPGHEIPERSWVYRFAKKYFFNDFGAYEHLQYTPPPAKRADADETPAAWRNEPIDPNFAEERANATLTVSAAQE